jgi:hypothetical protein
MVHRPRKRTSKAEVDHQVIAMADRMQVAALEKPEVERVLIAKRVGNERVVSGEGF